MELIRALFADVWASLRQPMTAGQKQSAVLLVPLIVALVLYGRPAELVGVDRAAGAPPPPPVPASELRDEPAAPAPDAPVASTTIPPRRGTPDQPSTAPPAPAVTAGEPVGPARPPAVVALVRGPSDAEMAEVFGARSGLTLTTLDLTTGDELCPAALAAGELVLAGEGVGPRLRRCLVEGGATVLAYDALGDLPPGAAGPGQVLSTRRGFTDGLVDLATWGVADGALVGRIGLVTMESARAATERALPRLEATGADVAAIAYLPDDRPLVEIPRQVLEFVRAGVESVVLAAPVDVQQDWVLQASIVAPDTEYLVADAFDAVIQGGYADGFDGSRALTTLTFPWASAPSEERRECDDAWESAGGGELSTAATVRMYAWCLHARLASTTDRASAGWQERLREASMPSPLTSDVGPIGDGGWGPTEEAVLVWRSACGCWTEDRPFVERTPTRQRS